MYKTPKTLRCWWSSSIWSRTDTRLLYRAWNERAAESSWQASSPRVHNCCRMEEQVADSPEDSEKRLNETEEETLLQGGNNDYPVEALGLLEGMFATNVISVLCQPGMEQVYVGTGDGHLHLVNFDSAVQWTTASAGSGGILSLACQGDREALILAGFMDGTVAVHNAQSGQLLTHIRPHRKYCVRVRWLSAERFATAAWDNTFAVHEMIGQLQQPGEGDMQCRTLWSPSYTAPVQDFELISNGQTAVVAIRSSNYLRLLSMRQLQEEGRVNMNALGDDHVSFTASHLAASPDGAYLLVSTDGPRIIMFRIQGWQQVRNFYGLPTEQFHQPCALWHASGFYIVAAAAAGHVYIFHVGTTKVVASFKAHAKNVRALSYDAEQNVLVSGSFDKTCKIFMHNVRHNSSHACR